MTRAEQLARIPEAISREAYQALIAFALPDVYLGDIIELRFGARAVTASVVVRDADGQHVIDGDRIATHEIVIPVVDGIEAALPQDRS